MIRLLPRVAAERGSEAQPRVADRPPDELELLRAVARRDRRAFETLYRAYYPRLFRYLLRLTRRADLIEEILNDVLFVVWEKAGTFHERSRVSTWILGIAYHKALKALEHRRPSIPLAEAPEDGADPGRLPGDLSPRELRLTVARALHVLSPEQRAVVELTYYFGYSYPEIAAIVGCPVNTVKTRMFHARRRLRPALPGLGGRAGAPATLAPEEDST